MYKELTWPIWSHYTRINFEVLCEATKILFGIQGLHVKIQNQNNPKNRQEFKSTECDVLFASVKNKCLTTHAMKACRGIEL